MRESPGITAPAGKIRSAALDDFSRKSESDKLIGGSQEAVGLADSNGNWLVHDQHFRLPWRSFRE